MSVIGINSACQTWQAGSYSAVGTTQDAGQSVAMSFASLMAGKLNGQLNTTDQSDTVFTAAAKASKKPEMGTDRMDGIHQKSVSMKPDGTERESAAELSDKSSLFTSKDEITEEDIEEAMEVIETVIGRFAEILGITPEELEQLCDELGIDAGELLDKDSMTALVLKAGGGEDITDLLTDENMLATLEELSAAAAEISDSFGITAEELKTVTEDAAFIEKAGGTKPSDVTDRLKELKDMPERKAEPEEARSDEEKEIPVTIERRSEKDSGNRENSFSGDADREASRMTDTHTERTSPREPQIRVSDAQSFVNGMQNAIRETSAQNMISELGTTVRDIVYQLVDAIKIEIGGDNTSLEMKLSPESLGRVQLNISSKEGVMTARITTENQVAKEAIESQLQTLKETITNQGFKVDAIEVTVSSFSFSDSKNASHSDEEGGQGTSREKKHGLKDIGGTQESSGAEDIRREVMLQTGSTVSYVA